jgi:signal transduction histidine kinase
VPPVVCLTARPRVCRRTDADRRAPHYSPSVQWPNVARASFLVVVAVLAVTALVQVWTGDGSTTERVLHAVVALAVTLPLLVVRRWPLPVLLVVLVAAALDQALGGGLGQVWFVLLLAVFGLGRHAGARASAVGAVVLGCAVLAVDLPRLQDGAPLDEVLPGWFILAGTWGLGRWLRWRRAEHDRLVEANAVLARDRDDATRAAVVHERARIATELHDLVAHAMAVIVLQAQAAGRVLDADPQAAAGALRAIEDVGRQGLVEMRRLVDVLVVDPDDDLVDRPSLRHLDDLVERVRAAGLDVELCAMGLDEPLPAGLDLSAYRIVQESLTNVLKHAGAVPVQVVVQRAPGQLELSVRNEPGRTRVAAGGRVGHGLIGMRERTALYGGELEAGPTGEGGFLVRAVLPLPADEAAR